MITLQFAFVNEDGNEVDSDGRFWADYFDDAFENVASADSIAAANAMLAAAYKGADCDGVGVKWTVEND